MDIITVFMRDLDRDTCKPLPADEQRRLIALAQAGDTEARNRVVASMLRYVHKWAVSYSASGTPLLDLVQVGALGVMRAIEKFDLSRDIRFSTYCTFWIRQTMARHFKTVHVVHVPCNADNEDSRRALKIGYLSEDEDGNPMPIVDDRHSAPERECEAADEAARVQAAIDQLSWRQQYIVRGRMEGRTQTEIAKTLGISKERVRQIEQEAHGRLAVILTGKPLPDLCRAGHKRDAYPWEKWLNGETWRLSHGRDFDTSVRSFRVVAHQAAKRRGKSLRVRAVDGVLVIQSS